MSLIVAKKEGNNILIVSDTKLSFPDDREASLKLKRYPSDGIIKTTILNSAITVSFAGAVDFAEQAIKKISIIENIETIKNILLEAHILSNRQTDFIICIGMPIPIIFEIKSGKCSEVNSSWIGSQRAFNRFQDYMLNHNKKENSGSYFLIKPAISKDKSDLFTKASEAMDKVIDDEDVPEVDGFKVNVIFEDERFKYSGYFHSYAGNHTLNIKLPPKVSSFTFPIPIHGSAASGGYTINFFDSYSNYNHVGIHVLQGNFGIIYSRENNGLLKPKIYNNIDEIDFVDLAKSGFKLSPLGTTQNREKKYFEKGNDYFDKKEFMSAIEWYNKTIQFAKDRLLAETFYRIGLAYLNLNMPSEAVKKFQYAINIDSSYQKLSFEMMNKFKRSRQ